MLTEKNFPLHLPMELIDLQSSQDLEFNFLACHILEFYKNHLVLSRWFSNLIHHTQQVGSMFGATYNYKHKNKLYPKLSNTHSLTLLLLLTLSVILHHF